MRFTTRKRRQAPAVIIISLIDILIVLLIFFITSTHFKKPRDCLVPIMSIYALAYAMRRASRA